MYVPIGEFIRQTRRQQGLTQTELGADRFSKSYVSAVERGQILPSYAAIRHFAERLHQPYEELEQIFQKTQNVMSSLRTATVGAFEETVATQDALALLDGALPAKDLEDLSSETSEYPFDQSVRQALKKYVRTAYLKGKLAQEKGDFVTAQSELEFALALAPDEFVGIILDTLATGAYALGTYERSLAYAQRAHQHLYAQHGTSADVLFQVELHCGHALRALAHHQEAQVHYENARKLLSASQNIRVAGQLSMGLGYCMYAALYQDTTISSSLISTLAPEEVEYRFQQACSFLLQSRMLSQVGGDVEGEAAVRLIHAMVLLDLCTWRQQQALQKAQKRLPNFSEAIQVNCSALLDEIDEQCSQVLLLLAEKYQAAAQALPVEVETQAALALVYLMRSLNRRAAIAQLGGYVDTAKRERALACTLCQNVLNAVDKPVLSWELLQEAIKIAKHRLPVDLPFMPRLPDLSSFDNAQLQRRAPWLGELYFAASEIHEDYALTLTDAQLANKIYTVADEAFYLAITWMAHVSQYKQNDTFDISYAVRMYQRCSSILEQRLKRQTFKVETSQTILRMLRHALLFLPTYASSSGCELQITADTTLLAKESI